MALSQPLETRFWSKVDKRGPDDCWNWTAFANPKNGYGYFCFEGRSCRAHRVAWQIANNANPGNLYICHTCDNRLCVNPSHLFLGSQLDNMRDMYAKGRARHPRKTHCQRGHELSADNVRVTCQGSRLCVTCDRLRVLKYRERKSA